MAAVRSADRNLVHRRRARAALHCEDVIGRLHEGDRVHGAAVDPHFIMKVVARGAAGGAHAADLLAARDMLAGSDRDSGKVAIAGGDSAPVVDLDEISITAAIPACAKNGAVGSCINGSSV